jgi:hypothetical protein
VRPALATIVFVLEGIDGLAARAGARWGWRPDPRTAAVLLGAYGIYQFALSLQQVGNLITEASGTCANQEASFSGYHCVVPGYVRVAAITDLFLPVAFATLAAGAVLIFMRSTRGAPLAIGGLCLLAAAQVVVVMASVNVTAPPQSPLRLWPGLVSALAALLVAGFVLLLPQPKSAAQTTPAAPTRT